MASGRVAHYACYPIFALLVYSVVVADVGVVVVRTLGNGPLVDRMGAELLVLVVGGASAWWWLVCTPSMVDISGGRLRYEAPLASGTIPLDRIRGIRPAPVLRTGAVVRIRGRAPLAFPLRPGWAELAAQLARHPSRRPLSD